MLRQLEIIAANTVSAWFSETRGGIWPAGGGRARPSLGDDGLTYCCLTCLHIQGHRSKWRVGVCVNIRLCICVPAPTLFPYHTDICKTYKARCELPSHSPTIKFNPVEAMPPQAIAMVQPEPNADCPEPYPVPMHPPPPFPPFLNRRNETPVTSE